MKRTNSRCAAFFTVRVIASLLCLTTGMLTLFAFAGTQHLDNNTQITGSSLWLTRLASTLGIELPAQRAGDYDATAALS